MSFLKQKSIGGFVFDIFNYTFMVVFCISILFPFWDMIVLSFTHPDNAISLTLRLWPERWCFDAYEFVFSDNKIINAYTITIYRTVAGTLFHIVLTLFAAYPLSKRNLPLRKWLMIYIKI